MKIAEMFTIKKPDTEESEGLLMLVSKGQRLYVEAAAFIQEDDTFLTLDAPKCYGVDLKIHNNQWMCNVVPLKSIPIKTTTMHINKQHIVSVERIEKASFIYSAIVKSRSSLIIPGNGGFKDAH